MIPAWIMAIFFLVSAMVAVKAQQNATSLSDFQLRVKNSENNVYTLSCVYSYNENYYDNSHVQTTTQPENWVNSGSSWDLKYQRVDESHATGGRCQTDYSGVLQGDGEFSATLYIHSNVAPSDGVFTIGILSSDFVQSYELDLIVVNIEDNTVKSGAPGKAFSIDLGSIDQKWIDIITVKSDGRCSTTVYSDGKVLFDPEGTTHGCDLKEDGKNFFVINSRSRGGSPQETSSYISISAVSWEQA